MSRAPTLFLLSAFLAASGCAGDEFTRLDGVTPGAGEAMRANTVMQMADPWPQGVSRTRLLVPAVRPQAASQDGAADASADAGAANP